VVRQQHGGGGGELLRPAHPRLVGDERDRRARGCAGSDGGFRLRRRVHGGRVAGARPQRRPDFTLDEAFSFYLSVDTQDEVDRYWELLTADGGQPGPCGWCKDKYGVSWQVIPKRLDELCGDYSTDANKRAMNAMLQMGKIDIAALEQAYAEEESTPPS
jgi:hypothetical protein